MKTVIGVIGSKGSGKETFVYLLEKCLKGRKVFHTRSSDVLLETLKLWDIPHTRNNHQRLAIIMNDEFGEGSLTHAVSSKMKAAGAEISVFDGVRWHSDVRMIREFPNNFLVYVTAPMEIRYQRMKMRSDKIGEDGISFEKFKEEEEVETEAYIPEIGKTADVIIPNEGSIEELKKRVEEFCRNFLK